MMPVTIFSRVPARLTDSGMRRAVGLLAASSLLLTACNAGREAATPVVSSGGDTTVNASNQDALSLPVANIRMSERARFSVGNAFFRQPWVTAPASTAARDGLGPLFNTNTCQSCHIKDGRGHAPASGSDDSISMLVRISVPPQASQQDIIGKFGAAPHPVYGGQIQDRGIAGVPAEARIRLDYETHTVRLADGAEVTLRKPALTLADPAYGALGDDLLTSLRIAPAMIGLGLLEAIPEADLLAAEDPEDSNDDGISGQANRVWDFQADDARIGRFGWKAGQPDVRQQSAAAFAGDMGLTTALFSGPTCQSAQTACLQAPDGGSPEVSDDILAEVVFYSRHLAVPARRNTADPAVQKGAELFRDSGCAGCHTPEQRSGPQAASPMLANQRFTPYTDLLLHDMGEGLADGRPEFSANGQEWRTPPLWGIGLAKIVSENAGFLHDGRAQTLLEAILWHGGEAQTARDAVVAMTTDEREALLAFLNSL